MTIGNLGFKIWNRDQYLARTLRTQFFYGQREVLLSFLNLDNSYVFLGEFQHGVLENGLNITIPPYYFYDAPRGRLGKRLPWVVYNENTANQIRMKGREAVSIGAPYLYASKSLIEKEIKLSNKVLVIPRHYTVYGGYRDEKHKIRRDIARWREIADGEIVVCLYWLDYLSAEWQEVAKLESIELKCMGVSECNPHWGPHRLRTNFLPNMSRLLRTYKRVIFDDVSSGIFFSIYEGNEIFINPWNNEVLENEEHIENPVWKVLENLFPNSIGRWIESSEHKLVNDEVLGVKSMRTKEELSDSIAVEALSFLHTSI